MEKSLEFIKTPSKEAEKLVEDMLNEVEPSIEEKEEKEEIDVSRYVKEKLSASFEVEEIDKNQIKVVLKDQMQFNKWFDVLNYIEKKSILSVEFLGPDGKDNEIITVTNPFLTKNGDKNKFNITIRFDKGNMKKDEYEKIKGSKDFSISHIMSPIKPETITMHPGMLFSFSVEK